MNSFNKINKKNNKNNKEAVQRSGDPRPMDCKRNPVTPFQETGTSSSMTCLDGNPTTSAAALARADKMSAILKPPQGVTTTSCQSADVPTTSASISRAVCGQSDPRLNKKYRAAQRHIERLSKISAEAMSSEDKRNLTWAKAYIAETSNSGASASVKAAPKRQRSGDDVHQTSTVQSRKSQGEVRPRSQIGPSVRSQRTR
ncbi:hypothetical protein EVAR_91131_1 [Eumeta japonica]|uniref:Uncharacterized protein n=1 Tax=Eumeta variegata TaxID=151549 RepID=A0A4C1SD58_EUMVA|nr:hypothetical protein EVAR_91131_1 [Eumeta japonica]